MSVIEIRSFAGYVEKLRQYVREVEGLGAPGATGAIYVDLQGIPTVGYGFALLVGKDKKWTVTDSLRLLPRLLTDPMRTDLNAMRDNLVDVGSGSGAADKNKLLLSSLETYVLSETESVQLLDKMIAKESDAVKGYLGKWGEELGVDPKEWANLDGSREFFALLDAKYNSVFGEKIGKAFLTGNRAGLWYELRYGNKSALAINDRGNQKRRYWDAELVGLIAGDKATLLESRNAYSVYTSNVERIIKSEALHGVTPDGVRGSERGGGQTAFEISLSIDEVGSKIGIKPKNLKESLDSVKGVFVEWVNDSVIDGYKLKASDWNSAAILYVGNGQSPSLRLDATRFDGKAGGWSNNILVGADAHETMIGGKGNDFLIGQGGNDLLLGGQGSDTLMGGQGVDTIQGDTSKAGEGVADTLIGGVGNDVYVEKKNFGVDTIIDTDGSVVWDDVVLWGGTQDQVYKTRWSGETRGSKFVYELKNADASGRGLLVVTKNGDVINRIEIPNFISGNLGITLGDDAITPHGLNGGFVISGDFIPSEISWEQPSLDKPPVQRFAWWTTTRLAGGELLGGIEEVNFADVLKATDSSDIVIGKGGNDALDGGAGDDQIDGGSGGDLIVGGYGADMLDGGDGNDVIVGDGVLTAPDRYGPDDERNHLGVPVQNWDHRVTSGPTWSVDVDSNGTHWIEGVALLEPELVGMGDVINGESGDDVAVGSAKHDLISLGLDNDIAWGGQGDDTVDGDEGDDTIYGDGAGPVGFLTYVAPTGNGNDVLRGGAGLDTIRGGGGVDVMDGGAGADVLYGDESIELLDAVYHGDDTIDGGEDNDRIFGGGGNDDLQGGAGDDWLSGEDQLGTSDQDSTLYGDDNISGGAGQDTLVGGHGEDTLDGGEGDDSLYGSFGNDVLIGGAGVDYLNGGDGDDTYIFDAEDLIPEGGRIDAIDDSLGKSDFYFTGNVSIVSSSGMYGGASSLLEFSNGGQLLIRNALNGGMQSVEFEAGNEYFDVEEWLISHHLSRVNISSDQVNQNILGGVSDDRLSADHDNTHMRGGQGADEYLVASDVTGVVVSIDLGDGVDSITASGVAAGRAHIDVSGDVAATSLTLSSDDHQGQRYYLSYGLQGDKVVLSSGFSASDVASGRASINDVELMNGDLVTWESLVAKGVQIDASTWIDRVVSGSYLNDHFISDERAQVFQGYAGNDTYAFGRGDGQDTIDAIGRAASDSEVLRIKPGVASGDLMYLRVANDLQILIKDSPDSITIHDAFVNNPLSKVVFADGTELLWSDLPVKYWIDLATAGDDSLVGAGGADDMFGLEGRDTLRGGAGNDTIIGGAGGDSLFGDGGDDLLVGGSDDDDLYGGIGDDTIRPGGGYLDYINGGEGDDTYQIGRYNGSIHVRRAAYSNDQGIDTIEFIDGIVASDIVLSWGGIRTVDGQTNVAFSIEPEGPTPFAEVDQIQFSNGELWSVSDILKRLRTGTDGGDEYRGSSGVDVAKSGAGDDHIDAYGGNDVIEGGRGRDSVDSGAGADVLKFAWGDGDDRYGGYEIEPPTSPSLDVVKFGAGIRPSDVEVWLTGPEYLSDCTDMVLKVTNEGGGSLTFVGAMKDGAVALAGVEFANGAYWSGADLISRVVGRIGGVALGVDGAKIECAEVVGAFNERSVQGSGAADVFVVTRGSGEVHFGAVGVGQKTDTILFDSDVMESDLVFLREEGATDLIVRILGGNDAFYLRGGPDEQAMNVQFMFKSNGAIWSPTEVQARANAAASDRPLSASGSTINLYANAGNLFSYSFPIAYVDDPDSWDTVTHSVTKPAQEPMPSWLTFDDVSRTLYGTPGVGDVGNTMLYYWGYDEHGAGLGKGFYLNVGNSNNHVPTLVSPVADRQVVQSSNFSYVIPVSTFSDPDGNALTYSVSLVDGSVLSSSWLSFNPSTRTLSGVANVLGTTSVRVTATDAGKLFASDVFDIEVKRPWVSLNGSSGADNLVGDVGNDTLIGLAGNDVLSGAGGADRMEGGLNDDVYYVDDVSDVVMEFPDGGEQDLVIASVAYALSENVEYLDLSAGGVSDLHGYGNSGGNKITGSAGVNLLSGLAGDDLIDGSAGDDVMLGGHGDDTFVVDSAGDEVVEFYNEGVDTIISSVTYVMREHVEHLKLVGLLAIDAFANDQGVEIVGNVANNKINGGLLSDRIDGGDGMDSLDGGSGSDVLIGGAGDDWLFGQDGAVGVDTLIGRDGADCYFLSDASDVIVERYEDIGDDAIYVSTDYALPENVEFLFLEGDEDLNAWCGFGGSVVGNEGNNRITGGDYSDVLSGGLDGVDTLMGGADSDFYLIVDEFDQVVEGSGGGYDVLYSYTPSWITMAANVEAVVNMESYFSLNANGNELDNAMTGSSTRGDRLKGMAGNDVLKGLGGADALYGGSGNDKLYGDLGSDSYYFERGDGVDRIYERQIAAPVANGDKLIFSGDIKSNQLWFSRQVNDLVISVMGGGGSVAINNWFVGESYQVELFKANGDTKAMNSSAVNQLISIMSTFEPATAEQTQLSAQQQSAIASVWL